MTIPSLVTSQQMFFSAVDPVHCEVWKCWYVSYLIKLFFLKQISQNVLRDPSIFYVHSTQ